MANEPNTKTPTPPAGGKNAPTWQAFFAINSSTGALLGAIILVCMGSELWNPFLPKYIETLKARTWLPIVLLIALYGSFRDLLEAVNYLLGGWLAGKMNTRRSLLIFNAAPLIGLAVMLAWKSPYAVFVAIPFLFVWDSIAGPALLTVVGDSLAPERRAMAFSLQSLFRRVGKISAGGVTSVLVAVTGTKLGIETAFGVSAVVILASLAVQFRFMKTASKDTGTIIHQPIRVLRGFDPQLKRLLVADIFARLAEGMPRELLIMFTAAVLAKALGLSEKDAVATWGGLWSLNNFVSGVSYVPMGAAASKPSFGKKPYIGVTFFFFASFPAVLAGVGYLAVSGIVPHAAVVPVMAVAFIFMGLRELGEPARKAMIVDLIPPGQKTQAIGIYWSARSVAVMLAPLVGGLIWLGVNRATGHDLADATGPGPYAMLLASSLFGTAGVIYYYLRFAR